MHKKNTLSGFSLAYGFLSSLDALISQAFGARCYRLMGLYSQRAVIIMSIASIPIAFLWTETFYILHYGLGIDRQTAKLAGEWATILSFGLWPTLMFEILRKFLQGGQIVWPVVAATCISTAFNIITCFISTVVYKHGFYALAVISALSQWVVSI